MIFINRNILNFGMRFNKLFIFIIASLLLSGAEPDPSLVTIKGAITNPIGNGVSFVFQDASYDATADENGVQIGHF